MKSICKSLTLRWIRLDWQGVNHFKKIQYADGITYGELFLENEYVYVAYAISWISNSYKLMSKKR